MKVVVPESVEAMVPVEPIVAESPTWLTAPEAVTAASARLAGRVNR